MGNLTTWHHDTAGRVTSKVYADGSGISYTYEPLSGRLSTTTDEKSQVKTAGYNLDDTLASTTYTNALVATPTVSFTYDPNFPRVTAMTDGTGTTTYSYYPIASGTLGAGQLSSETVPLPAVTLNYAYDALGRRTSYAIGGVGENLSFDSIGRVNSAANALGTFTYTYVGGTSRLNTITYPNGIGVSYAYQPLTEDFRLQSITNNLAGGTLLSQHSYAYDAMGKVTQWTQNIPQTSINRLWACTYDNADQLTAVASENPSTQAKLATGQYAYTFDLAGNRLTQTVNGSTTTASYNPLNELVTASGSATSALPQLSYTWDAENRLTAIQYPGTNNQTLFTYDGRGRNVQIVEMTGNTVNGTKQFAWDGLSRVEEHNAAGTTTNRYFDTGMQIVSGTTAGNYYYTGDHLGSIREMTNSAGAVSAAYDYDPNGVQTNLAGTLPANFGFTGLYSHAPSALNLAGFRAYAPNLARWTSRDPLLEAAGANMYAYVGNTPIMQTDGCGLCASEAGASNLGLSRTASAVLNESLEGELLSEAVSGVNPAPLPYFVASQAGLNNLNAATCFASTSGGGDDDKGKKKNWWQSHHAWAKYVFGPIKQQLVKLGKGEHQEYHRGLDEVLPRWIGKQFYDKLPDEARDQIFYELKTYTQKFDAQHGTQLYKAMLKEGFPSF